MSTMVAVGEELMPQRETKVSQDSQTTTMRKLSRNQGLVIQEETVAEDSPDIEGDNEDGTNGGLCRKSKLGKLTCEDGS